MQSRIRGAVRLFLVVGWVVVFLPVLVVSRLIGGRALIWARKRLYRVGLRISGVRVVLYGNVSRHAPTLFVANHASYFDIVALGSVLPAAFIARHDMEEWPVFGWIAKLTATIFVERVPARASESLGRIRHRLMSGGSLVLFPEGTTSNGSEVLGFKSTFFHVVEEEYLKQPLMIQPVSLAYTRLNNLPMGVKWRPLVSWYGEMALLPHIWELVKHGGVTIEIRAHELIPQAALPSRKALSRHCHEVITQSFGDSLRGRAWVREQVA